MASNLGSMQSKIASAPLQSLHKLFISFRFLFFILAHEKYYFRFRTWHFLYEDIRTLFYPISHKIFSKNKAKRMKGLPFRHTLKHRIKLFPVHQ